MPAVRDVPSGACREAGAGFIGRMTATRLEQLQERLAGLRGRLEDNRARAAALADAVERVQRESVVSRSRAARRRRTPRYALDRTRELER
jgi:hypothetical protein